MITIDGERFDENRVRRVRCASWDEFVGSVRKTPAIDHDDGSHELGGGVIFRGHANPQWKLSSRLERALHVNATSEDGSPILGGLRQLNSAEWYEGICSDLLERFKDNARGISGFPGNKSDDELYALGRHFGLLSPFLDWTESPYMAAFFGFIDLYRRLEFGASINTGFRADWVNVWGLRFWQGLEEPGIFDVVFLPRERGTRLWAQAGVFTRLSSRSFLELEPYLESRGLAHYLECYELRHEDALVALRDLDLMRINLTTMFPDLQGAAEQANIQTDQLRIEMAAGLRRSRVLWEEAIAKKADEPTRK